MRQISDEICREYGLSVVDDPKGKRRHISECIAEREGKTTERGNIRRDIDIAIECNTSTKYFYRTMESLGYIFERRGSFLRIRPDNGKKWFRLDKLGEGYTEEDKVDGIPKPVKFCTVTAPYLNVRTEPKEDDNVMCVIKKDTSGIVNFVSGEWTNITVSPINGIEVTGYVMSKFIKLLNEED